MPLFNWGPKKKEEEVTMPIIGSDYVEPIKQNLSVGPRVGLDPAIWGSSSSPDPISFTPGPANIVSPSLPSPFLESEIRQHNPSILDTIKSWNIRDAILSSVPNSIIGGAFTKAADKIGEATLRTNANKFPYGIPTQDIPEYVPQNTPEKIAQFVGANLVDAPIWALNPGAKPASMSAPYIEKGIAKIAPKIASKVAPYAQEALSQGITGGTLGFAQGKISGESNIDALKEAGITAGFGAALGPALKGVGDIYGHFQGVKAAKNNQIGQDIANAYNNAKTGELNPTPKPKTQRYSQSSYWKRQQPEIAMPEPQNGPSQPLNINLNRVDPQAPKINEIPFWMSNAVERAKRQYNIDTTLGPIAGRETTAQTPGFKQMEVNAAFGSKQSQVPSPTMAFNPTQGIQDKVNVRNQRQTDLETVFPPANPSPGRSFEQESYPEWLKQSLRKGIRQADLEKTFNSDISPEFRNPEPPALEVVPQTSKLKDGIPQETIDRVARRKGAGFNRDAVVYDPSILKNDGEPGNINDLAHLWDTTDAIPPKDFTPSDISVGDEVYIPIRNKTQNGTDAKIVSINGDKASVSFHGTKPVTVPIKDIKWNHSRDEVWQSHLKKVDAQNKANKAETDRLNSEPVSLEDAKSYWERIKDQENASGVETDNYSSWEIVDGKPQIKGKMNHETIEFTRTNRGKDIEWHYVLPKISQNPVIQSTPPKPKIDKEAGPTELQKTVQQIRASDLPTRQKNKIQKELNKAYDTGGETAALEVAKLRLKEIQNPKLPKVAGQSETPKVEMPRPNRLAEMESLIPQIRKDFPKDVTYDEFRKYVEAKGLNINKAADAYKMVHGGFLWAKDPKGEFLNGSTVKTPDLGGTIRNYNPESDSFVIKTGTNKIVEVDRETLRAHNSAAKIKMPSSKPVEKSNPKSNRPNELSELQKTVQEIKGLGLKKGELQKVLKEISETHNLTGEEPAVNVAKTRLAQLRKTTDITPINDIKPGDVIKAVSGGRVFKVLEVDAKTIKVQSVDEYNMTYSYPKKAPKSESQSNWKVLSIDEQIKEAEGHIKYVEKNRKEDPDRFGGDWGLDSIAYYKKRLTELKPEHTNKEVKKPNYQRTIDELKAEMEDRLQKDIEVMKGTTGKGKEDGQIFFDEYGDTVGRVGYISNNPPWYEGLDKKPRSEKAWRELALKHIYEGYNGVSGKVGPDKDFIQLENDIKQLEEIQKAQDEVSASMDNGSDSERLSYPGTVANAGDTPEVFRKSLTENETEFLYEVKHNKDTVEKAADMLSGDYDSTLAKIYDPKESLTVEQIAAGQILIKRALAKGDYDTAKALTTALGYKAKTDGQKIQILAAYGKTTPEGILRFAEKEIEKARTPKQNKKIKDKVTEIERDFGEVEKKVVGTITKEIEDDLPGILNRDLGYAPPAPTPGAGTGVGRGANGPSLPNPGAGAGKGKTPRKPKEELSPEEQLARRVASTLADPKKKDDPIRDMVNILFKVAQESPLPDNRLPKNPLELVVKAIKNRGQYREIWNNAKVIVEEKFADNPDALDALDAYFEKGIKRTFPQKELNKAVDKGLKELAKDVKIRSTIAQVVREHYTVGAAMRTDLVNALVEKSGLKKEEAKILEKYIRDRMKDLTKQKKESILAGMFKERITPKNRTIIDKIIEMSNLGGFQHEKYKDLVAKKLGFPGLSEEGLKSLNAQAQKIQTMKSGEEKSRAISKMLSTIAEEVKVTPTQKIATIQTMAQLLNPKTAIRNLVGNTGLSMAENIADVVGTGIDKAISIRTGKRTVTLPSPRTQVKGMKKGGMDQARDIKEGVNTFTQGTKHDLPRIKTFRSGPLSKLEDIMNYELRVPDRAFYQGAKDDVLRQEMKLAKIKGGNVSRPTPEMEAIAEQDALYRTLQDENTLSRAFVWLKKTANLNKDFGLGDFLIKYPKTPANILNRGIDFSPAGFVKLTFKTISEVRNEGFNQRNFVKGLSRALTGTVGLTGVGAMWHKLGIMTGSPDEHGDVATLERQVGLGEFKINVSALNRYRKAMVNYFETGKMDYDPKIQRGDNLVSYDWFQPNAIPLVIGADIDANKGTATGVIGSLVSILQSSVNAFSDQPVMQGVEQIFRYGNVSQGFAKLAQGVPASFWPTILNQVRQIADNQKRSTYDPSWGKQAGKMVQNKIPFAEAKLPKVYDAFGQPEQVYKKGAFGTNNPFNVMVNPAFVTQYNPTREQAKALDVYRETGNTRVIPNTPEKSITYKKKKYQLTPEQYSQFQKILGEQTKSGYAKVSDSLSAENKAKLMEKYQSDARDKATQEMLKKIKK